MQTKETDHLYAQDAGNGKFQFNESVARVFDDMLERSVPMYRECTQVAVDWCLRFACKDSAVYDLGCSTGTLLKELAERLSPGSGVKLVGVDNSRPMLKKARAKLAGLKTQWELVEADLAEDFSMQNASVVVMNYTLQFLPPTARPAMLKKLFAALNPGGCLVLIEKIIAESPKFDAGLIAMHHEFKRAKGYSELEISKKREALEDVLIPLKASENEALLKQAGFASVEMFFKWNNFAGFVALK